MRFSHKRHSLSGKLVLLFLLSAIIFVVLVGSGIRFAMEEHFRERAVPHLAQYLEYISNDIGYPADQQKALQLAKQLNVSIHIHQQEQSWSSSGESLHLEDLEQEKYFEINGIIYSLQKLNRKHYIMSERSGITLLISLPPSPASQHSWKHIFLPITILLLLIMALYHATRRLVSPILTIQNGVKTFAQGNLEHRIEVSRCDELGQLAKSANEMADNIQQMLDAKRQLLLAISHELRSPLTRAKVSVELMEDKKQKQQINNDLNEIEQLIEEILETERLSLPHKVLNKKRGSINKLIRDLLIESFSANQILSNYDDHEIELIMDPARIRLLLKNLLDNAIRHTPENATPPMLTIQQNGKQLSITITDHGEGIEMQHLPHLTEPFYRVDSARQRETGGYGIGLYLCKMITAAHGGTLTIDSELHLGTTITVIIPIKQ